MFSKNKRLTIAKIIDITNRLSNQNQQVTAVLQESLL